MPTATARSGYVSSAKPGNRFAAKADGRPGFDRRRHQGRSARAFIGTFHARLVDDQLSALIEAWPTSACDWRALVAGSPAKLWKMKFRDGSPTTVRDQSTSIRRRTGLVVGDWAVVHPLARAALVYLVCTCRLLPVAAQVPVASGKLGTLIDQLWVSRDGQRYVLIELKKYDWQTVHEPCQLKDDSQLPVLRGCTRANTPANQHQLQLAFTREMLTQTHPSLCARFGNRQTRRGTGQSSRATHATGTSHINPGAVRETAGAVATAMAVPSTGRATAGAAAIPAAMAVLSAGRATPGIVTSPEPLDEPSAGCSTTGASAAGCSAAGTAASPALMAVLGTDCSTAGAGCSLDAYVLTLWGSRVDSFSGQGNLRCHAYAAPLEPWAKLVARQELALAIH